MTAQNGRGQGEQPLYEGVVLPPQGESWTPDQQRESDRPAPPAGQPWGEPWGPGSAPARGGGPVPPPAPQWGPDTGAQPWGPGSEAAAQAPAPPPEPPRTPSAPQPSDGQGVFGGQDPYGQSSAGAYGQAPYGQGPYAQGGFGQPGPAGGEYGGSFGGAQGVQQGGSWGMPPAGSQPQPQPRPGQGDSEATRYIPPVTDVPSGDDRLPQPLSGQQSWPQPQPEPQPGAQPLPSGDAEATQLIPPQPSGDAEATQLIPPQPSGDAEATQMLPPQQDTGEPLRPPLPPESGGASSVPQPRPAGNGPVAPPPAGFESLFRSEPGDGESGSTQSLPVMEEPPRSRRRAPAAAPGGQRAGDRLRALATPPVLIGAGVVLVAGLGVAVGMLISGGGEEEKPAQTVKKPASSKPAPAPDPVKPQAQTLDALLNDSNNSRDAVIRSVEHIKVCKNLDQAVNDLKGAAAQRNSLVERLNQLTLDKVPDNAQLKAELTKAWGSSASADNHYAAWAAEVKQKGPKGCHKGRAVGTPNAAKGNAASGAATAAKKQAANLWNPTAQKYGLKTRQFGQL